MKPAVTAIIIVVIIVVAAVLGVAYYSGYFGAKSNANLTNVTFALPASPTSEAIPAYVAANGGFWKQLGLNVTLGVYSGSAMPDAIVAGQIQFGFVSFITGFLDQTKGVPLVYIGVGDVPNGMVLIVNNSKYHTPQDLQGATIGVTHKGTLTDIMFQMMKSYYNLNIQEAALGGLQGQLAALQTNQTQGFFWTYDQGYAMEDQGIGRILVNGTSFSGQWANDGLWSTNSTIKNNPTLVNKVLQGWLNAAAYCKANETYCIQQTMSYMDVSQPVAQSIVSQDFFAPGNFSSDGAFTPSIVSGLNNIRSIMLQYNLSSDVPPVNTLYTTQFTPMAPQKVSPSMMLGSAIFYTEVIPTQRLEYT